MIRKADKFPESLGKNEKSIWEHYNEMAAVEDNIREVEWRDLADTILVFVCLSILSNVTLLTLLQDGLFAAFLSAFLVFTIPQLQPSSTDITMDVLIHISHQLSNSTTPAYTPAEFTVSPSVAAVNVLFFLSLALVLIDAFLAMLVKSWLQEFDRSWRKYTVADLRAQERERRLQGLEHWRLAELVNLLPILIQTALLFFCIGLIVLLFPVHLISAIFSSVALVAGFTFYLFTIYVSVFDAYAPFSSPVSRGLIILINELQTTWLILAHLIARHIRHIISGVSFRTSRPSLPREHEPNTNPAAQSLPGNNGVTHPYLPRGTMGVEKHETIAPSRSQIDPQTYVDILERLVTTTAEAVENIPVFLDLLDQPMKDPTLRPSNIEKWKKLLHTTLGLLGDPSTFSSSIACTIARNVLFCYDSESADQQLSRSLIYRFDHMSSGQIGKRKSLDSLFASYLHFCCEIPPTDPWKVSNTIASLEPSNAVDAELLWMTQVLHRRPLWQYHYLSAVYQEPLEIFAAVLTYVSSTEQTRRSQVPLTAAVIYVVHTIKSAIDNNGINLIDWPHIIPGTVLTTSESMSMNFHQVNTLNLWSDECVELASALLQPHTFWSGFDAENVWKFQLALIAALYIDSAKQAGQAAAAFAHLLTVINIPVITMTTWGWADAYDQAQLACYWYMAVFQRPIYQEDSENAPVQYIGDIIMQTIEHCSEMRLSALLLLEFSVKYLCVRASSSNLLRLQGDGYLCLKQPDPDGPLPRIAHGPFNPWVLLHLDTLLSPSSILDKQTFTYEQVQRDLEQLEWTGAPEQVHIAMSRLALYDPLQGEEDKETKKLKLNTDADLLKLLLKSNDYEVCTGAFKCCLHLASQPSTAGDIAGIFISETLGCQWVENLIRVLCGSPQHEIYSWEFLTEHLTPKWAILPPSWCCDFATAFLFLNVHTSELPAYQWFAYTFRYEKQPNQAFLPFLGTMVECIKYRATWGQLDSLGTWLAQLPEYLENQAAHVKLENVLATRQEIGDENLRCFAELPMRFQNDQ